MLERSDIAAICKQFTQENGITITEGARQQIALVINCPQTDRHETWGPEPRHDQLQSYFQEWAKLLPVILRQVADDHQLQTRITTIDIVYWTGRNLENVWQKLCPFPGEDELPVYKMAVFPWTLKKLTDLGFVRYEREDAEIP